MPGAEKDDIVGLELVEYIGMGVMVEIVFGSMGILWKYEKGGDAKYK